MLDLSKEDIKLIAQPKWLGKYTTTLTEAVVDGDIDIIIENTLSLGSY